jgi:hypothetical protein
LQPLADGGWRYAQVSGDFYLRTSIEFHLDNSLVSPVTVIKERLPVQPRSDYINDRPSPSTVTEGAIESAIWVAFEIIETDMLADSLSRHACL